MEQTNRPAMYDVVRAVAKAAGTSMEEMTGASRAEDDVTIRWAAMLLGRRLGHSMDNIGRRLGGRDHTTVLHGIRKAKVEIERRTVRGVHVAQIIDGAVASLGLEPIDWGFPRTAFAKPPPEPPIRKPKQPAAPKKDEPQFGIVNARGEIICTP